MNYFSIMLIVPNAFVAALLIAIFRIMVTGEPTRRALLKAFLISGAVSALLLATQLSELRYGGVAPMILMVLVAAGLGGLSGGILAALFSKLRKALLSKRGPSEPPMS